MARLTVIIIMSWRHEWQDDGDNNNELMVEDAAIVRCMNIWQTVQKHLWRTTRVILWLVLSWIETSLCLPCNFPIKTNLLLSFPHFPTETYCQSATVIVVRATRQHCLTDRRHTCPVYLLYPSLTKKFGKCSSSKGLADSLFYLNFLDFTCLSLLLDPSKSFRFYRLV